MAVSATRDSSAMKALAVITALFLPGTYIASLFSMSMFNWQGGDASSSTSSSNGTSSNTSKSEIVMPYLWIYWLVSVVLTLVTVVGWRLWWTLQDREFRSRLPEAVQTDEGRTNFEKQAPNELKTTFWEDVFGMKFRRKRSKENVSPG
jgi:hypothetical protein